MDVINEYFKKVTLSHNDLHPEEPYDENLTKKMNMSSYINNFEPKFHKLGKNFDNWVDLMNLSVKSNVERSEINEQKNVTLNEKAENTSLK